MDHFGSILTGQPAVTEPSCAGSSGVFNVLTRQWDADAVEALGPADVTVPRSL
jgi:sugar (pentulose or hexulose) kinase